MSGGIETVLGAGNQTWPSNPNDNLGNDSIDGGLGDDSIDGGLGNDTIRGGGGNDTLRAGNGSDSLLGDGDNDWLIGGDEFGLDERALFLRGNAGNDTLVGSSADAILHGDDGADSLFGGSGTVGLHGGTGNDTLVAGHIWSNIRVGGGNEADSLLGGNNSDSLAGGSGDDTLSGGLGDDILDGGEGNDFVSYADAASGVDVQLNAIGGGNPAGGADGDGLSNFEGVIGGDFDDTLIGNTGANTLIGGDGIDSLDGNGGNDLLDYGAGDEEFVWGVSGSPGGAMTLLGGSGQDTLNLGANWLSGPVTDNSWINFQQGSSTVYSQGWENVVCFAEGTRIVTPGGEDAVENLRAGDMVLAMRGGQAGFEALRWVGFMDVAVPRNAAMAAKTAPILIKAGAIAPGMPARDLRVSPDHAMEVDGHLIPAKHLVNGSSIIQEVWCKRVRYFHLELEAHGLLLSEGTWSESYLDDGNRDAFNNTAMTGLFLDFEAGRSKGQYDDQACLPVLRQGLKLDEIHGRIALRAAELAQPAKGRRWG